MIEDSQNAKASAMDKLSFHNPLFGTYAVAACIMILKAVMMSWLTVGQRSRDRGRGVRALGTREIVEDERG